MAVEEDVRLLELKKRITTIPDFPKPGINFKDIFPIFKQPSLLPTVTDLLLEKLKAKNVDVVVGLDSRGFLFAPLLAMKLNCTFVPVRKRGKLPGKTIAQSYKLEYGEDTIEIQTESIHKNQNVVIVDDLIATGGTMEASYNLILKCEANILCCMCVIELCDLKGWGRLPNSVEKVSLLKY